MFNYLCKKCFESSKVIFLNMTEFKIVKKSNYINITYECPICKKITVQIYETKKILKQISFRHLKEFQVKSLSIVYSFIMDYALWITDDIKLTPYETIERMMSFFAQLVDSVSNNLTLKEKKEYEISRDKMTAETLLAFTLFREMDNIEWRDFMIEIAENAILNNYPECYKNDNLFLQKVSKEVKLFTKEKWNKVMSHIFQ
jgi:hypothetical protein